VRLEVAQEARIVLEIEQPGPHPEQVLEGQPVAVGDRVIGEAGLDQVVERKPALADQLEDHDGRECLRRAADPVVRVGGHRCAAGTVCHSGGPKGRLVDAVLQVDERAGEAAIHETIELGLDRRPPDQWIGVLRHRPKRIAPTTDGMRHATDMPL
jgi:hypothetical protein